MPKFFAFYFFSFFLISQAYSQDLITTKKGKDINGKVLRINQNEVKYSISDSTFTLPKTEILLIRYANGTKDIFTETNLSAATAIKTKISNDSLFIAGRNDAKENYNNYRTASTITLVSTMVFPPLGLVTAIGTSTTTPARKNLEYPSAQAFTQPAYANGYTKKAHKMKAGQVWTHFGIGCAFSVLAAIFIYPQFKQ